MRSAVVLFITILIGASAAYAQMPSSPRGQAATQIGGEYEGRRYNGGKWITINYGRPILRGRTGIFGEGENYGRRANAGAPVWRAGANMSTRFKTEADLMFGESKLPAGEYSLFVELKAAGWIMIFSNHKAKERPRNPGEGIWGSYGYSKEKDVIRVPMTLRKMPLSVDQLTYNFFDVKKDGGDIALMWETTMATTSFKMAK